MDSAWVPASVRALRGYTSATFVHDLTAGVMVGLVALPLAMAFAIASGLTRRPASTAPSSPGS